MRGYEVISDMNFFVNDQDLIISSTGNISREVYHFLKRPQIYLRGSMGLPVGVGLGLAITNPEKRVIVITGDGSLLMGFGSLITAAYYKPSNLKILILDNSSYFTTGGQKTVSSTIDFTRFLGSLNITTHQSLKASKSSLKKELEIFLSSKRFSALHLIIEDGKMELENIPWHPETISQNFQNKFD